MRTKYLKSPTPIGLSRGIWFEGASVNYRHPGPRRVWKGGSEPQLLTPDPVDPLDRVDPALNSKWIDFAARRGT